MGEGPPFAPPADLCAFTWVLSIETDRTPTTPAKPVRA